MSDKPGEEGREEGRVIVLSSEWIGKLALVRDDDIPSATAFMADGHTGDLSGMIVAGVPLENDELPIFYWNGFDFIEFGADEHVAAPTIFKTPGMLKRRLRAARAKHGRVETLGFIAGMWWSPHVGVAPIDKYIRMSEGKHFPGSPQQ